MNMKMDIIIMGINSYDMTNEGGQKGASAKIIGDSINTQNYSGISISSAEVDYSDLSVLTAVEFPAKFEAKISFVSFKNRSGKEITGIKLNEPVFKSSMVFVEKK